MESDQQQKVLQDLRRYAYERDPMKVRKSVTNYAAGAVKPKCEALEEEIKKYPAKVKLEQKVKTEVEIQ